MRLWPQARLVLPAQQFLLMLQLQHPLSLQPMQPPRFLLSQLS
jgi:hypothetical protein